MKAIPTTIPEVQVIQPQKFQDERGYFMETFQLKKVCTALGQQIDFVQDNESYSLQGVLRGMHFQHRHPQGKLVRVVQGEIFDVALDIRPDSPTFGRHVSAYLSDANQHMLWVPPGFAHGFYVTRGPARVLYKATDYYQPQDSYTLHYADPGARIEWPIPEYVDPILSKADESTHLILENLSAEVYQQCA